MIEDGLVDEVKSLISKGYLLDDTTAAQAIGYKEILGVVLRGDDFKESIDSLKQATRNYAKRQLTWFRRERDVIWFDKQKYNLWLIYTRRIAFGSDSSA
jgi:tRNA dimethylallyltransferase